MINFLKNRVEAAPFVVIPKLEKVLIIYMLIMTIKLVKLEVFYVTIAMLLLVILKINLICSRKQLII